MPSTTSRLVAVPLDSSTVMTPSLPTLSIASAMSSPISGSLPAIDATCATSSLPLTGMRELLDLLDGLLDGHLDAALDGDRVAARGHVAQALAHDGLGQNGGGGGAVAGHVVGLGRDFAHELRAHVLIRVLELDLLGDGDAVLGDGGAAPLLVQNDVAALGAKRDLHGRRYACSRRAPARGGPLRQIL